MTQAQFEETFKARKELFHQQMAAIRSKEREQVKAIREEADAQAEAIKQSYHAGNAELEKIRRSITFNPAKKQREESFNLWRNLNHLLSEWNGVHLDQTNSTCNFNLEDDKAVFTIEVPYVKPQNEENNDK